MLESRKRLFEYGGDTYFFIRSNRGAGLDAAKWVKIDMDQAVQIAITKTEKELPKKATQSGIDKARPISPEAESNK